MNIACSFSSLFSLSLRPHPLSYIISELELVLLQPLLLLLSNITPAQNEQYDIDKHHSTITSTTIIIITCHSLFTLHCCKYGGRFQSLPAIHTPSFPPAHNNPSYRVSTTSFPYHFHFPIPTSIIIQELSPARTCIFSNQPQKPNLFS